MTTGSTVNGWSLYWLNLVTRLSRTMLALVSRHHFEEDVLGGEADLGVLYADYTAVNSLDI